MIQMLILLDPNAWIALVPMCALATFDAICIVNRRRGE